jgi:tetratricopeptide (TPR) repeat protein
MAPKLDPADGQLLATATALLNERRFDEALQVLRARIAQGLSVKDHQGLMLLAEIGGLLIDTGAEGRNEQAITEGLALLEENRARFEGLLTRASVEYNLGNAKSALVDLRNPNAFTTPGLAEHDLLLAAKNHYWSALKAHDRADAFARQLRTNLANALRKSGRITEALTEYDDIIADDPTFTMAHFHRGLALLVLERVSGAVSLNLLWQAATDYRLAAEAPDARLGVRDAAIKMRDYIVQRLAALGHDPQELERDYQAAHEEANEHSAYRTFTLRHHLGLSEHSLYCDCRGARRDELMIATNATPVAGDRIPRLELILNRLKAEFGTARLLYCHATKDESWDLHEEEMTFAELFEGEQLGVRTEFLRTSFRLCLGILDKIALGVCELYDVADPQENLSFETFWKPRAHKGKAGTRWQALVAKSKNPALVALYSQATDLGSDGEWSLFKAWRNDLEHRFLILTTQATPPDRWNARTGIFDTRCVTSKEFSEQTLHLLQFTRSAIFNYTFCARYETRPHQRGHAITRTLTHK